MNIEINKKYKQRSRILLGFGILLTFILPIIIIQPTFFKFLNFSNSGQIGDTIGGITSPIVGLIGAILVFLSFEQQVIANNIQKIALDNEIIKGERRNNYSIIENHYQEIKYEFEKLKYIRELEELNSVNPDEIKKFIGEEALDEYVNDLRLYEAKLAQKAVIFEYNISFILYLIIEFLEQVRTIDIDELQKKYLFKRFYFFYVSKLEYNIEEIYFITKKKI